MASTTIYVDAIARLTEALRTDRRGLLAWYLRGMADASFPERRWAREADRLVEPYGWTYREGRRACQSARIRDAFEAVLRGGGDINPAAVVAFAEMVRAYQDREREEGEGEGDRDDLDPDGD